MKAEDIAIGDIVSYRGSPRKVLDIDVTDEGSWVKLDSDHHSRVEWVLDEKLDPYIPSIQDIHSYLKDNLRLEFKCDSGCYGECGYKSIQLWLDQDLISETSIS